MRPAILHMAIGSAILKVAISIKQGQISHMKITKYLLAGAPALLAVTMVFTPLVRAESGSDSTSTTTTRHEGDSTSTTTRVAEAEPTTDTENQAETESTDSSTGPRAEEVKKRRAELELKIEAIKAENKVRLTDARLKACENHQTQINNIIQKRSQQATNQLAVFTKISDQVQAFVKSKNLTVANYDTLVSAINDKQAAAQAAIDANSAVKFDCSTASADKPGILPRTTIDAVRTALQDYRTAIKNLIVQVKASAEKASSTTTTTPSTSTSGEVSQ